jgi:hypothetical protein
MVNLQGAVGRYLSGLLMAELVGALNLDGFEGRVFTTVGNQVVSRAYIRAQNDNEWGLQKIA